MHGIVQHTDDDDANHQTKDGTFTSFEADTTQKRSGEAVKFKTLSCDRLTCKNS